MCLGCACPIQLFSLRPGYARILEGLGCALLLFRESQINRATGARPFGGLGNNKSNWNEPSGKQLVKLLNEPAGKQRVGKQTLGKQPVEFELEKLGKTNLRNKVKLERTSWYDTTSQLERTGCETTGQGKPLIEHLNPKP